MSNKEILEKAIQKAIDRGWRPIERKNAPRNDLKYLAWRLTQDDNYMSAIFNRDFAKALWGDGGADEYGDYEWDVEDYICDDSIAITSDYPERYHFNHPLWMWHLQQMVIASDPIKYLGEHLND